MREFFVQLYKDLKMLTGIRQYDEIANSGKPRDQAQADFDALVNGCMNVCGLFSYIPEDAKKRIIKDGVLEDPEFYGLFPKTVYKYLNKRKDKYFTESHHIETNAIEYEAPKELSPETQKMVDDYLEQLRRNAMGYKIEQHELQAEISRIKREDKFKLEPKGVSTGYKPDPEKGKEILLRQEWRRQNFDPITGKPKEGWIDFETWKTK